jgi:hypothetical protein
MGYVLVKQSDGSYRSTKTNDNSRGEKVSQSEYNRRYGSSSSSSSKSSSNKSSSSRNSSSSSSSSSNRSSSSSSNSDAIQRLKDESTRIYNETGRWDTPRQLELKRQADQLRGYLTNDDGTRKIGELPNSSSSSSRKSSSGSSSSSSSSSYNPFNTGINKDKPYNQFYNNYADVIRDIARKHNVDMGVAADMFRSDVRYGTGNNGKQYGDFTVTDEMRQAERKAYDDNYAQMDDRNRRIADQINSRQYTQKLTNALYGSTGSNVTGTTPNIDTSYTPTYSDDPAIAALQRRSYEIYKQTGRWDTPEQLELKRQADQLRGYLTNDDGTQYVGPLQNSVQQVYNPYYQQDGNYDLRTEEGLIGSIIDQINNGMSEEEVFNRIVEAYKGFEEKADDIYDEIGSYNDYLRQAENQINPIYDRNRQQLMEALDQNALRRGFFGQLPTEAFKRYKVQELEGQRAADVATLANALRGQDINEANNKINQLQQNTQLKMQNILSALGQARIISQDKINNALNLMNQYRADRQEQFNKELQIANLTGMFRGEPTVAYQNMLEELGLKKQDAEAKAKRDETEIAQAWARIKNSQEAQKLARERFNYDKNMDEKKFYQNVKTKAIDMAVDYFRAIKGDMDLAALSQADTPEKFAEILKQSGVSEKEFDDKVAEYQRSLLSFEDMSGYLN